VALMPQRFRYDAKTLLVANYKQLSAQETAAVSTWSHPGCLFFVCIAVIQVLLWK